MLLSTQVETLANTVQYRNVSQQVLYAAQTFLFSWIMLPAVVHLGGSHLDTKLVTGCNLVYDGQ